MLVRAACDAGRATETACRRSIARLTGETIPATATAGDAGLTCPAACPGDAGHVGTGLVQRGAAIMQEAGGRGAGDIRFGRAAGREGEGERKE